MCIAATLALFLLLIMIVFGVFFMIPFSILKKRISKSNEEMMTRISSLEREIAECNVSLFKMGNLLCETSLMVKRVNDAFDLAEKEFKG